MKNIYIELANDSGMCEYLCIGFIAFNKRKLKYFQQILKRIKWWKYIVLFAKNIENLKL